MFHYVLLLLIFYMYFINLFICTFMIFVHSYRKNIPCSIMVGCHLLSLIVLLYIIVHIVFINILIYLLCINIINSFIYYIYSFNNSLFLRFNKINSFIKTIINYYFIIKICIVLLLLLIIISIILVILFDLLYINIINRFIVLLYIILNFSYNIHQSLSFIYSINFINILLYY